MKRSTMVILMVCLAIPSAFAQTQPAPLTSPNKVIQLQCRLDTTGQVFYTIQYNDRRLLEPGRLGITRADADLSKALTFTGASSIKKVKNQYELQTGNRSTVTYTANEQTLHFKNATGHKMDIIFRVSNDGVAFRYYFPGKSNDPKKIDTEFTSFHLPADAKAWLQPMSVAKTGWEQVNPCYEEFYEKGIRAGTASPLKAGWVFPALFQSAGHWLLITEANMDARYCASKLDNDAGKPEYRITFPDPAKFFPAAPIRPCLPCPGIRPGASSPSAVLKPSWNQPWVPTWQRLPIENRIFHLYNPANRCGAGRC
jgi:Glycoside hydrolase 97.